MTYLGLVVIVLIVAVWSLFMGVRFAGVLTVVVDDGGGKEEGRSWRFVVVRGSGYHTRNHSLFRNNH